MIPRNKNITLYILYSVSILDFANLIAAKSDIAQNIHFETAGNAIVKPLIIGEKIYKPSKAPIPIGKRLEMDFLKFLKMFDVDSIIDSKTPVIIATVPPLKPGITVPIPIRKPFANLYEYSLKWNIIIFLP